MQITAIILGISLSANLGIALGTNWNRFKNWLSEWILKIIIFKEFNKHIIPKNDNKGKTTISFILITQFIDLIIENSILETKIEETITIGNQSYHYNTIPGLATLEIKLDISNERKNELKLETNKITFWILASGGYGWSPTGYEIWADTEHLWDVYRVLTLFYIHSTKNIPNSNPNDLINFTRSFRIKNERIQTETFKELSRDTRISIREQFKRIMNTTLNVSNNRILKIDQLVQYMNKKGNYLISEKLKFGTCVKNRDILLIESLDTEVDSEKAIGKLEEIISSNQEKFGENAKHINSLAIISNFKTFLRWRHMDVNKGKTDDIKGINSISLFDKSFEDIVTDANKNFAYYPFISKIMIIMYLEYTILRNEGKITVNENSMDDIINMLEDPTCIIGLNENYCSNQFVELNPENLPPPNSGMIVDHTKNFSEFKLPNTLNKETAPLLTKRTPRSN